MNKELSKRRAIENEAVFRQANESIQKGLDIVNQEAKNNRDPEYPHEITAPLLFYCECSDEYCRERIETTLRNYNEIHNNRRQFLIKPGHEVSEIERVVRTMSSYSVVRKIETPPEFVLNLKPTDVRNV